MANASCAVIRSIDGPEGVRAWLRRFVQWRVDGRLYLLVLVALPAAVIASYAFLTDGSEKPHGRLGAPDSRTTT